MSELCPATFIPVFYSYKDPLYQAFLEAGPQKKVEEEDVHRSEAGQKAELEKYGKLWDDRGFDIKTPMGGVAGSYNGIDNRAIVMVLARSDNSKFKPRDEKLYDDISPAVKAWINAKMVEWYGPMQP